MAAHQELLKKLHEDEDLRSALMAAPTRDAKQDVVRNAGLDVPDHHDVLQAVAGGQDLAPGEILGIEGGSAAAAGAAAFAAAAAAV